MILKESKMKLTELKNTNKIKVLVYGESGSGKTCFGAGFPTPLWVADFDGKVSSAARYHTAERISGIEYESYRAGIKDDDPIKRFESELIRLEDASRDGSFKYKTIMIDSVTTYADSLITYVVETNPGTTRYKAGVPVMQDYLMLGLKFKNHIQRLLALDCNVVMVGHIQEVQNEKTKEITNMTLLPGKLAKWMPIVFEEVYRSYVDKKPGKNRVYMLQTQSDYKYNCRSQIPGLPENVLMDYSELIKEQ